jgi:hypothetical protein
MNTLTIVILLFAYFIIDLVFATAMDNAATRKGYNAAKIHAFAYCFFLGILGACYIIALPDLVARQQNQAILNALDHKNKENELPSNNIAENNKKTDLPEL